MSSFPIRSGRQIVEWVERSEPHHFRASLPRFRGVAAAAKQMILATALCLLALAPASFADEPTTVQREILVPFGDLNVVLEDQPQRVMLDRKEYESLLAKAVQTPVEPAAPQPAAVLTADYSVAIANQRAKIEGTLAIEVFRDGLHPLPLDLSGVGLTAARLDDHAAAIGQQAGGPLTLFVEGKGTHHLKLSMVAPLETTAARQTLQFRLPHPPSAHMTLAVPGDVEIKGGAEVISRVVDAAASETRFELLPPLHDMTLVMSLNSHLKRQDRVVVARSVQVNEVTQAYERLHVTATMEILHRAVDDFRWAVPEGFEVTEVSSPRMAHWGVIAEGKEKLLDVHLREATTEPVTLSISAFRTPARLDAWTCPKLEPRDVAGQVAVIGLLVEEGLRAESITSSELLPIDTAKLEKALPASVFRTEPGAPILVPVVAYYAPQSDYQITARFVKPPAKTAVTSNVLLAIEERGHEVRGGFILVPEAERLFAFDFTTPADWKLTAVTGDDGRPLAFERYGDPQKPGRIHIPLPQGIPVDKPYRIAYRSQRTPAGWLSPWSRQSVEFPRFAPLGASTVQGAIAVVAGDDLTVRPVKIDQLRPLDEPDKEQYGLKAVHTDLAYHCEGSEYQASLVVERVVPRLTARTFSFFRVEPDTLTAHYELIYQVENARTRQLSLLLPDSTPESLSISGMGGLQIKEYASQPDKKGLRRWTALLEDAQGGELRLAVDLQQPLTGDRPNFRVSENGTVPFNGAAAEAKKLPLPIVRADGVAYQSGLAAVEAAAEVDVTVTPTGARKVDVGELADAEYQPGRRLLGAFGFVADGNQVAADVRVNMVRHPGYPLHAALVQQATLDTLLSAEGVSITTVHFQLRSKGLLVEVKLPEGSKLWSVVADGNPLTPQTEAGKILIGLPAADKTDCALDLTYETPVNAVPNCGSIRLPAPELALRAGGAGVATPIPLADLVWRVELPQGYSLVDSGGTVVTESLPRPPLALAMVGSIFVCLPTGGCGMAAPKATAPAMRPVTEVMADLQKSLEKTAKDAEKDGEERNARGDLDRSKQVEASRETPNTVQLKSDKALAFSTTAPATPSAAPVRNSNGRAFELAGRGISAPTSAPAPPAAPVGGVGLATGYAGGGSAGMTVSAPAPTPAESKPSSGKLQYALQGVRSLKIDTEQDSSIRGPVLQFTSLGVDPQLKISLAKSADISVYQWALALVVVLGGLRQTKRPFWRKVRYVVVVVLLGTILPLPFDGPHWVELGNAAVYGAFALIPYYFIAMLFWMGVAACRLGSRRVSMPATAALLLLTVVLAPAAWADPPPRGTYMMVPTEPPKPVHVPDDAVLVPYDAKVPGKTDRVLIPYAKYVELWNRAYPEKPKEGPKPPADFALAGASYKATLSGDEYLLLSGNLDIDLFTDAYVTIPLGLAGGVLTRAELDGKPARLENVAPEDLSAQQASVSANGELNVAAWLKKQPPAQQAANAPAEPPRSLVALYAVGKGRHQLALEVRLHLERRGGWRVAEGILPSAPATALALAVPQPKTEVRLGQIADRPNYETEKADETIDTALGPHGALSVQWRPKVAEGQIDSSLTAHCTATFDVQEDSLRLACRLQLEFRRAQREFFQIDVPADYLVEKVEGQNVRGWEIHKQADRQSLSVTLLKAARDTESIALWLTRRGPVGQPELAEFDVPMVSVTGAALQAGEVTVRRSPDLDLRTLKTLGVTRTDIPADLQAVGAEEIQRSPLGYRAYQAYQFATLPFNLRLAAAPVGLSATAQIKSVLKIAQYQRDLESFVTLATTGRPWYRIELFLPDDLEVQHVSTAGEFHWAITTVEKRRLLTVYLNQGQSGQVNLLVRGQLGGRAKLGELPLPRLELRGVPQQRGQIAVQADPAFNVEPVALENCGTVLLEQLFGWLNPQQRQATRLALDYHRPDYQGTLRLTPRTASVSCLTISNVRVTSRAVEETILLDFTVQNAGVRELAFLLPWSKEEPRIQVPMLREKTVVRSGNQPDAPWHVRLQLQDERMGQIRVLVQNDRVITGQKNLLSIPVVETGRTDRQFLTLESTGRDEVVVDRAVGLEAIDRQQKQWQLLRSYLPGNMTQAYLAVPGAPQCELVFRATDREAVETAGARIWLAETSLVLDDQGAYRAAVLYRLNNTTEQFLQIDLPAGAELWTAHVAGEPVKPVQDPGGNQRRLWVPLVKTAQGDLDYPLVLKYAGKLGAPSLWSAVDFPLIKTVNITVARSLLSLHLPADYHWFDFGDKMSPLAGEEEAAKYRVAIDTEQAKRLLETVRHGAKFAQARAANSFQIFSQNSYTGGTTISGGELQVNVLQQQEIVQEAGEEIQRQETASQTATVVDNRQKLNDAYNLQINNGAVNVVQGLANNWTSAVPSQPRVQEGEGRFSEEWFEGNKLAVNTEASKSQTDTSRLQSRRKGGKYAAEGKGKADMQWDFKDSAAKGQNTLSNDGGQMVANSTLQYNRDDSTVQRYKQKLTLQGNNLGLNVLASNSYTGATNVMGGTLNVNGGTVSGPQGEQVVVNGGLVNAGAGMWVVNGANTYAGGTSNAAGTLPAMNLVGGQAGDRSGAIANGPGMVILNAAAPMNLGGGTLQYQRAANVPADQRFAAVSSTMPTNQPVAGQPPMAVPPPAVQPPAPPTGLASLDVEIPLRGTTFYFTAPHGDVEMNARAVSEQSIGRGARSFWALIGLGLLAVTLRYTRRKERQV